MLRRTMIALLAIAAAGMLAPDVALARGGGGFHGGGFHGGGFRAAAIGGGGFGAAAIGGAGFRHAAFANGFRGGGFHGGFNRGRGFAGGAIGVGLGYGLYQPYGYYAGYDGGYPYDAYDDSYYYGDGGCYLVQQRVLTPWGWRIRPIQVCN